jgi:S-formylglutathione hydrolase FrmB
VVRGWEGLAALSLVHGWLRVTLAVAVFAGLAGLLLVRRDRRWWLRWVPLAIGLALALLVLVVVYLDVTKPWPDPLQPDVMAWIGAGLFAVVLLVLGWRGRRWWVRGAATAAAVLVVLGAADGVNADFAEFPTIAAALQLPPQDQVSARSALEQPRHAPAGDPLAHRALSITWHAPREVPRHGAVFQIAIPGVRSGFHARPAWVYLPPADLTSDRPRLPLLEMIGGQPGNSRTWLDAGQLAQRMDAWAAAHHGLAPIVVMPDALGSTFANPMCLNSRLGQDDTYLAVDVPAWATAHLGVDPDHAHWAVGGMSFGGTCALQLAVAHPSLFPTFFDAEGQRGPTLGSLSRTVQAAFGGNLAAFDAVDPLHELAARRYPGSAGIVVVGEGDALYRSQDRAVAVAARLAGMTVSEQVRPGGHSWTVSGPALSADLPWLAARMGILP